MEITITNQQSLQAVDSDRFIAAVRSVFDEAPFVKESSTQGFVDVAIVDDWAIHELNRQYLDHDWPTDVLSFVLEKSNDRLEGQIVVSAETAIAQAEPFGWTPAEELLLYVIHGALHLVGFCDKTSADVDAMREAESRHLAKLGVERPATSPVAEGKIAS